MPALAVVLTATVGALVGVGIAELVGVPAYALVSAPVVVLLLVAMVAESRR